MFATQLALAAVGGLIFGSFLNVVAYRLPLGESLLFPSSHCPRCAVPIKPYDNIPVVGYLLLRGRCRGCAGQISVRYPIVEAITGALAVAVLMVKQNATMALSIADRGYVLWTGEIVLSGAAPDLLGSEDLKRAYLG